jgi:hypothetical protein
MQWREVMTDQKIVPPIDPALLPAREKLAKELGQIDGQINNRIEYIIDLKEKTFKRKCGYFWYHYGAGEGDAGDLEQSLNGDQVSPVIEYYRSENIGKTERTAANILLRDGSLWYLDEGFPIRWLYEAFEEELTNGKLAYEDKEAKDTEKLKQKKELKKQKEAELAKSAQAKLTKEELKALKSSLK